MKALFAAVPPRRSTAVDPLPAHRRQILDCHCPRQAAPLPAGVPLPVGKPPLGLCFPGTQLPWPGAAASPPGAGTPPRVPPASPPRGRRGRAGAWAGGEAPRSARPGPALPAPGPQPAPLRPVPSHPIPSRSPAGPGSSERGQRDTAMSHGARVIRTGVSSGGPAAPPPVTVASSSAGSDAELMDGGYFRSCAGMLKVAQMVRGERGWGRCRGARWGSRSPRGSFSSLPDGSGERRRAGLRPRLRAGLAPQLSQLPAGRKAHVPVAERSVAVCRKLPLRLPSAAMSTSDPTDVYEPKVAMLTFWH